MQGIDFDLLNYRLREIDNKLWQIYFRTTIAIIGYVLSIEIHLRLFFFRLKIYHDTFLNIHLGLIFFEIEITIQWPRQWKGEIEEDGHDYPTVDYSPPLHEDYPGRAVEDLE